MATSFEDVPLLRTLKPSDCPYECSPKANKAAPSTFSVFPKDQGARFRINKVKIIRIEPLTKFSQKIDAGIVPEAHLTPGVQVVVEFDASHTEDLAALDAWEKARKTQIWEERSRIWPDSFAAEIESERFLTVKNQAVTPASTKTDASGKTTTIAARGYWNVFGWSSTRGAVKAEVLPGYKDAVVTETEWKPRTFRRYGSDDVVTQFFVAPFRVDEKDWSASDLTGILDEPSFPPPSIRMVGPGDVTPGSTADIIIGLPGTHFSGLKSKEISTKSPFVQVVEAAPAKKYGAQPADDAPLRDADYDAAFTAMAALHALKAKNNVPLLKDASHAAGVTATSPATPKAHLSFSHVSAEADAPLAPLAGSKRARRLAAPSPGPAEYED